MTRRRRSSSQQPAEEPAPDRRPEERLYCIRNSIYVQYDGNGERPRELETFMVANHGEYPPYIPLPARPTTFYLGERYTRERAIKWPGRGKLPDEVFDYVREHGTLPRHE